MTALVIVFIIVAAAVLSIRYGADSRPRLHNRQDWQSRQ